MSQIFHFLRVNSLFSSMYLIFIGFKPEGFPCPEDLFLHKKICYRCSANDRSRLDSKTQPFELTNKTESPN